MQFEAISLLLQELSGSRILEGGSFRGEYGELGAPVYNGGWELCPQRGPGTGPPPPEAGSFLAFIQSNRQICPILVCSPLLKYFSK